MTFSPLTLSLIIVGSGIVFSIIVYLWIRQQMVDKKEFNALQQKWMESNKDYELEVSQKQQVLSEHELLKDKYDQALDLKNALDRKLAALESEMDIVHVSYREEKEVNARQKVEITKNSEQIIDLNKLLALNKAAFGSLQEKMNDQQKYFDELRERSLLEFREIANNLLEEKSEKFTQINQDKIQQILKPLGENLSSFKKQVEETYDKESKQRFSLEEKIKDLVKLNTQISEEANNLTRALKGQSKTQGDWGEMILENILEFSGLSKGREYFVQESFKDDEGNIKRPDVKIKYPDDRFIIVDSKVSLTAYERMTNLDDLDQIEVQLVAHIRSIRNHIDELSAKEYDKFDKTLDFVMLFVPIEPAYLVAMQNDPELWNYAYGKRILLISPTNLIAALKMVADIWKRDDQNKNAREIAKRGEILYDKFVGFVSDMENIDKYINKADESWREAMQKLKSGKGNLIGQAEKLRKLGLKPKKSLPESIREEEE